MLTVVDATAPLYGKQCTVICKGDEKACGDVCIPKQQPCFRSDGTACNLVELEPDKPPVDLKEPVPSGSGALPVQKKLNETVNETVGDKPNITALDIGKELQHHDQTVVVPAAEPSKNNTESKTGSTSN